MQIGQLQKCNPAHRARNAVHDSGERTKTCPRCSDAKAFLSDDLWSSGLRPSFSVRETLFSLPRCPGRHCLDSPLCLCLEITHLAAGRPPEWRLPLLNSLELDKGLSSASKYSEAAADGSVQHGVRISREWCAACLGEYSCPQVVLIEQKTHLWH